MRSTKRPDPTRTPHDLTPFPWARQLRAWRVAEGISAMEAAGRFGVHLVTWTKWETGAGVPSRMAQRYLATVLEGDAT